MSLDVLQLRRPKIEYISPPVCEGIFSGSGSPTIVLEPFDTSKITGLVLGGEGNLHLRWPNFPGALCYNVYQKQEDGSYALLMECVPDTEVEVPVGCFKVSAITAQGETQLSLSVCNNGEPPEEPPPPVDPQPPLPPSGGGGGDCPFIELSMPQAPSGIEPFLIPLDPPVQLLVDTVPPGNITTQCAGYWTCNCQIMGQAEALQLAASVHPTTRSGLYVIEKLSGNQVSYTVTPSDSQCIVAPSPSVGRGNGFLNTPKGFIGSNAIVRHRTNPTMQLAIGPRSFGGQGFLYENCLCDGHSVSGLVTFPCQMRVMLIWELAPMPVSLDVNVSGFPSSIKSAWDGHLTYRSTFQQEDDYSNFHVGWNEPDPGGGAFRGAVCEYIKDHPTSSNSCGWRLLLFGEGNTIAWEGLKMSGATAIGCYYRASGSLTTPFIVSVDGTF